MNLLNAEISMDSLFPKFFRNHRDGMIIFDHSFMILDVNSGVETITGFVKQEMVGRNLAEFLFQEDIELLQCQLNPCEDLKPGKVHLVHLLHKSGSRKIVESSEMYISEKDNSVILSTIRDLTQLHETRMELEKQKHYSERNMEQILIESVIRAEESERRRISSDLHDGLGAELSTIKLYIQGLLDSDDKEYQENIGQKLIQLVEDAVDSLSDIAFNISPHILLEYGLVAAIEAFITRLTAQDKTKVSLEFDEIERFDLNKEITLYRTITELINNTLKHAGAENIQLELREVNGKLNIVYSDNGCGFDAASLDNLTQGMGIRNMKSRIESFKGNFDITARRDFGMMAEITLSVNEKDEEA